MSSTEDLLEEITLVDFPEDVLRDEVSPHLCYYEVKALKSTCTFMNLCFQTPSKCIPSELPMSIWCANSGNFGLYEWWVDIEAPHDLSTMDAVVKSRSLPMFKMLVEAGNPWSWRCAKRASIRYCAAGILDWLCNTYEGTQRELLLTRQCYPEYLEHQIVDDIACSVLENPDTNSPDAINATIKVLSGSNKKVRRPNNKFCLMGPHLDAFLQFVVGRASLAFPFSKPVPTKTSHRYATSTMQQHAQAVVMLLRQDELYTRLVSSLGDGNTIGDMEGSLLERVLRSVPEELYRKRLLRIYTFEFMCAPVFINHGMYDAVKELFPEFDSDFCPARISVFETAIRCADREAVDWIESLGFSMTTKECAKWIDANMETWEDCEFLLEKGCNMQMLMLRSMLKVKTRELGIPDLLHEKGVEWDEMGVFMLFASHICSEFDIVKWTKDRKFPFPRRIPIRAISTSIIQQLIADKEHHKLLSDSCRNFVSTRILGQQYSFICNESLELLLNANLLHLDEESLSQIKYIPFHTWHYLKKRGYDMQIAQIDINSCRTLSTDRELNIPSILKEYANNRELLELLIEKRMLRSAKCLLSVSDPALQDLVSPKKFKIPQDLEYLLSDFGEMF